MSKREKIFLGIAIFYIAVVAVPLLNFLIRLPVGLINIIVFVSALLLYPNAFRHRVVVWLALYFIILVLFAFADRLPDLGIGSVTPWKRILIEMAFILPVVSILCVGNYINNGLFYEKIGFYASILMAISFLYTSTLLMSNAGIIRENVAEGLSDFGDFNPLLPNYTLMHSYVFLIPGILCLSKYNKGYKRVFFLFFLFLTLYVIIKTQITTSMALVVFFVIFSLVWDPNNKSNSLAKMTLASAIVFVLYNLGVFGHLVDFLVSYFEGTAAETKMLDLQDYLSGNNTDSTNFAGRERRHMTSLMAFFDNVLIGNSEKLGGHSYLLDRLGGMGLIGFIPYAFLFINMIKLASKIVEGREQRAYFSVGIIGVFILIYEKGLFGQEGYLLALVVLPSMLLLRYPFKK